MPSYQEIMQSPAVKDLIAQIPFDSDYASLNKLRFYLQQLQELAAKYRDSDTEDAGQKIDAQINEIEKKLNETKNHFFGFLTSATPEKLTEWQQYITQKYKQMPQTGTASTIGELLEMVTKGFIEFLSDKSKAYLPEVYAQLSDQASAAEVRFPSAQRDRNSGPDFVHRQKPFSNHPSTGSLLASHAPRITAGHPEIDERNMQSFLKMLQDENVQCILALGGNAERLNYHHWSSGKLQTETKTVQQGRPRQQDGSTAKEVIQLTNTETDETYSISYAGFTVADNEPLNLNDTDLACLSEIYDVYQSNTVLVHCDSGVGRTGQVRLLFALLDQYHDTKDTVFKSTCDDLLENLANKEQLDQNDVAMIIQIMQSTLAELRKTRYCIQAPAQFTSSLAQFVLLLAHRHGYDSALIDTLRDQMGVAAPLTYTDSTNIGIVVEGDSDLESAASSRAPSRAASAIPPRKKGLLSAASSDSTLSRTESLRKTDVEDVGESAASLGPAPAPAPSAPFRRAFFGQGLPQGRTLGRLPTPTSDGENGSSVNSSPMSSPR